ncbi:hypothetical protein HOO65_070117 [Ceratocystis lukuohia]|uniref:Uncharacterized protein n=1 Tax=Ceratocystis lukuohia TaxID=2019550 RepID=A0ABR4MBJ7_9PEZI
MAATTTATNKSVDADDYNNSRAVACSSQTHTPASASAEPGLSCSSISSSSSSSITNNEPPSSISGTAIAATAEEHRKQQISHSHTPAPQKQPAKDSADAQPSQRQPPVTTTTTTSATDGSDSESLTLASSTNIPKQDASKKADRASSLKKATTFKAVSVNKTFLAAKSAMSASQLKTNDKSAPSSAASTPPTSSTLPATRPRLIAKTGGNGPLPKFAGVNSGRSSVTPEPAGVWNKNPPPPPPPATTTPSTSTTQATATATPLVDHSKLTDEELKKHGIHVANRLHTDDSKTSHNDWADIEDDDDEWAVPDSITWTDGTKTTLPPADEVLQSPILSPPASPSPSKHQPNTPAAANVNTVPSTGARYSARASGATPYVPGTANKPGLILRNTGDKPSLVAKAPPAVAPAKSPWATLPAVERASPVVPFVSSPQQSQRNIHGQHQGYNSNSNNRMAPPQDSYQSRNFDSSMDKRAGGDYGGHQDYMMQRSRQTTTSQDYKHSSGYPPRQMPNEGPYSRSRSGSSNMGHGPDRFHHMSNNSPSSNYHNPDSSHHERYTAPRRPSFNNGPLPFSHGRQHGHISASGRSASGDYTSANGPEGGSANSHGGSSHGGLPPHGAMASTSDMARPLEPNNMQSQRPMIYRGHNPSPNSIEVDGSATVLPVEIPEEETAEFQKKLMRERAEEAMRRRQEEERREEAAKQERLRLKLEALGPAPERQSTKKQTPISSSVQPSTADAVTTALETVPVPVALQARLRDHVPADRSKSKDTAYPVLPSEQPVPNKAALDASNDTATHTSKQPRVWESSGVSPHAQIAGPPPSRDLATASWGSGSNAQAPRNVWGAPNNDRGLGNGTFITDMSGLASVTPNKTTSGPTPIGPPSSSSNTRVTSSVWSAATPDAEGRGIREGRSGSKFHSIEKTGTVNAEHHHTHSHPSAILKPAWRSAAEAEGSCDFKPTSVESTVPVQPRPSRFFPTRDPQPTQTSAYATALSTSSTEPVVEQPGIRIKSPSPPPPIAEDHPVYDGNPSHPMVSFPKPQPVVKLPPALDGSASTLASGRALAAPLSASGHWQDKINSLLSGHKPQHRRDSFDHGSPQIHHSRPVSRNSGTSHSAHNSLASPLPQIAELPTTMPMSTECFEEPEMGSLPSIHIPKDVPEAAWNPATPQTKQLPRRFAIIHNTSASNPDFYEPSGQIRISLAGMSDPRFVFHASARSSRTQSRGSGGPSRSRRGGNRGQRQEQGHSGASNSTATYASVSASMPAPPVPALDSTSVPAASTPKSGPPLTIAAVVAASLAKPHPGHPTTSSAPASKSAHPGSEDSAVTASASTFVSHSQVQASAQTKTHSNQLETSRRATRSNEETSMAKEASSGGHHRREREPRSARGLRESRGSKDSGGHGQGQTRSQSQGQGQGQGQGRPPRGGYKNRGGAEWGRREVATSRSQTTV